MTAAALPERLGGRYRVLAELGRGGMGVVYRVEHVETGATHAAKVLAATLLHDPVAQHRFRREASAAAKLGGKHVVNVVDADVAPEVGGAPFLVMDLLEGRDLRHELAARGHLPPLEVVKLMTQLARALEATHGQGIVHRDLKPENLFLARQPDGSTVLKVLDFGLAKWLHETTAAGTGVTATGEVLGTPRYMAPEQAWGTSEDVGPEADRWALGMIAFELLTGQGYFEGSTAQILSALRTGKLDNPSELVPGIAPAFDAWFGRSCSIDKRDRFDGAREQVLALAQALGVGAAAPKARVVITPSPGAVVTPPTPTVVATPAAPLVHESRPSAPIVIHRAAPAPRVGVWVGVVFGAVLLGAVIGALLMLLSGGG